MKNVKLELKYIAGLISLGTICFVLILAIIVNVGTAFSWFAENRTAGAGNMSIRPISGSAETYIYEYNYLSHGLGAISSVDCDMGPGDEKTIVVLAKRKTDSNIDLKFDITGSVISVNYYGLSREITSLPDAALDSFLENYKHAGDYKYTDGSDEVTVSPYDSAITTDAYLGFTRPLSNALKISRVIISVSSAEYATFNDFNSYISEQIRYYYDNDETTVSTLGEFTGEQTLYEATGLGATMTDILAAEQDTYYPLTGGTPATFPDIPITNDNYYAVVYKIVFDSSVTTSATVNIGGTDRTVTMYNSNGFMYQRLIIKDIYFPSVDSEN